MKSIIKTTIRLFILFTTFQFLNGFVLSINNIINMYRVNNEYFKNIPTSEIIAIFLPTIVIWGLYISVMILLWNKCDIIIRKILENEQMENVVTNLNYGNILSVGFILLGIFIIIESMPRIFSYLSNIVVSKSRFVDKSYLKEYALKEIIEIIGIMVKIIFSFLLIKYKEKIIEKIK